MSVTTTAPTSPLVSFIERAAVDPQFDVQKFGELLRLQRDVEHDMARRAFNVAMAQCQSEMEPIVRDAQNRHLGNKYAKLEAIDAKARPVYTRHGFSVRFGSAPAPTQGELRITCTVAHDSGYFEENYLDAPAANAGSQGGRTQTTPVQGIGSAITYLRRYLLCMVFNIVLTDDDDDGESQRGQQRPASERTNPPSSERQTQQPRRTVGDWLDAIELALRDAKNIEEVDRILGREDVLKVAASLPADGDAAKRFQTIRTAALAKHQPLPDDMTGKVPEDDGWPGPDTTKSETATA